MTPEEVMAALARAQGASQREHWVRTAVQMGVPLHAIEEHLDCIDAGRGNRAASDPADAGREEHAEEDVGDGENADAPAESATQRDSAA